MAWLSGFSKQLSRCAGKRSRCGMPQHGQPCSKDALGITTNEASSWGPNAGGLSQPCCMQISATCAPCAPLEGQTFESIETVCRTQLLQTPSWSSKERATIRGSCLRYIVIYMIELLVRILVLRRAPTAQNRCCLTLNRNSCVQQVPRIEIHCDICVQCCERKLVRL